MCIRTILDTSAFRFLFSGIKNSAVDQLRKWINGGNGIIVYSTYGKYGEELSRHTEARNLIFSFVDNGQAIDIDRIEFEKSLNRIPGTPPRKSNDDQILALARASKATVLFSCDRNLCKDFANAEVIPKIGRQGRRSIPGLNDKFPDDITKAGERKKF